jgi:hypothetical protein
LYRRVCDLENTAVKGVGRGKREAVGLERQTRS